MKKIYLIFLLCLSFSAHPVIKDLTAVELAILEDCLGRYMELRKGCTTISFNRIIADISKQLADAIPILEQREASFVEFGERNAVTHRFTIDQEQLASHFSIFAGSFYHGFENRQENHSFFIIYHANHAYLLSSTACALSGAEADQQGLLMMRLNYGERYNLIVGDIDLTITLALNNIDRETLFPNVQEVDNAPINDPCPVCLGEERNTILSCRHAMCSRCLPRLTNNLCPVCKKAFQVIIPDYTGPPLNQCLSENTLLQIRAQHWCNNNYQYIAGSVFTLFMALFFYHALGVF